MEKLTTKNPQFDGEDPENGNSTYDSSQGSRSSSRDNTITVLAVIVVSVVFGLIIALPPLLSGPTNETVTPATSTLEKYIKEKTVFAHSKISDVIAFAEIPGSTVASIQGNCEENSYHYTWVRDSATIHTTVLERYLHETDEAVRKVQLKKLKEYMEFQEVLHERNKDSADYLGNAKYSLEGDAITAWQNPQIDGPASRAILMIRIANAMLKVEEDEEDVKKYIADHIFVDADTGRTLQRDLEFIADQYDITNDYEVWEELQGRHFYNQLVIRRALIMGNEFIEKVLKQNRVPAFDEAVKKIEEFIETEYWSDSKNTFIPRDNTDRRADDIQTTLAVLHSYADIDEYYSATNEQVQANAEYTLRKFDDTFTGFPINAMTAENPLLGTAIGRYTTDVYHGNCFPISEDICPAPCVGGAWFIAINGMGEYFFKVAQKYLQTGEVKITKVNKGFFEYIGAGTHELGTYTLDKNASVVRSIILQLFYMGDSFLERTKIHSPDGLMAEQINRVTGKHHSAGDLGWSYASFLTAVDVRHQLKMDEVRKAYSKEELTQEIVVHMVKTADSKKTVSLAVTLDGTCTSVKTAFRRTVGEYSQFSVTLPIEAGSVYTLAAFVEGKGCEDENLITGKFDFEAPKTISATPLFLQACQGECKTTYTIPKTNYKDVPFRVVNVPKTSQGKPVLGVRLAGNIEELGSWDPCASKADLTKVTSGSETDIYQGTVKLNAGNSFSFRSVLLTDLTPANCKSSTNWAPGDNYDVDARYFDQENPSVVDDYENGREFIGEP